MKNSTCQNSRNVETVSRVWNFIVKLNVRLAYIWYLLLMNVMVQLRLASVKCQICKFWFVKQKSVKLTTEKYLWKSYTKKYALGSFFKKRCNLQNNKKIKTVFCSWAVTLTLRRILKVLVDWRPHIYIWAETSFPNSQMRLKQRRCRRSFKQPRRHVNRVNLS